MNVKPRLENLPSLLCDTKLDNWLNIMQFLQYVFWHEQNYNIPNLLIYKNVGRKFCQIVEISRPVQLACVSSFDVSVSAPNFALSALLHSGRKKYPFRGVKC